MNNEKNEEDSGDITEKEEKVSSNSELSSYSTVAESISMMTVSLNTEASTTWQPGNYELIKSYQNITLSYKESEFLAAILQDGICEMFILNNCNRELIERMKEDARDKVWKPKVEEDQSNDRLEKINIKELSNDRHKLIKMQSDRKYITDTLIRIYLDLRQNCSFPSLIVQLNQLTNITDQNIKRERQYEEYRSKLKGLQKKFRSNLTNNRNTLDQCDRHIYHLLDEIDDSTWNSEIKNRYVVSWQNAKREQHTLAIDETEGKLFNSINVTQLRIQQEMTIHNQIEKFIKYSCQDYSDQIEYWMKRYDEELEQLDIDIRTMKEKRDIQRDDTAKLEQKMEDHRNEMEAWISFVTERANKKALDELRLRSAIKIQAWWRGTLARKLYAKMKKKNKKKLKMEAKKNKKK